MVFCRLNIGFLGGWAFVVAAVFVAPAVGQVYFEDEKWTADDRSYRSAFGFDLAYDNGLLVVGAPEDSLQLSFAGAVYVIDYATGEQLAKLLPSEIGSRDSFGSQVAIGGGVIAVYSADAVSLFETYGAVYLYDASTFEQIAKIIPEGLDNYDAFGLSLAFSSTTLAAGAPGDDDAGEDAGAVYLIDNETGAVEQKVVPNEGVAKQGFGSALAIGDGLIAIGAPGRTYGGPQGGPVSGAVYIFDLGTGEQVRKLVSDSVSFYDDFGYSVAISNGVLAVGSFLDDEMGLNAGSATLFDLSTGKQIGKFFDSEPLAANRFGFDVAINDRFLAVTAVGSGQSTSVSVTHLFDIESGNRIAVLEASDGEPDEFFGRSVLLIDDVIAVGAAHEGVDFDTSGAIYLYDLGCDADFTNDGVLDFLDAFAFLQAFEAGNPIADFNNDGVFDFFDISAFLQAFVGGCP